MVTGPIWLVSLSPNFQSHLSTGDEEEVKVIGWDAQEMAGVLVNAGLTLSPMVTACGKDCVNVQPPLVVKLSVRS